jgi:hypothetical protein
VKWYLFDSTGILSNNFRVIDYNGYVWVLKDGEAISLSKRFGPDATYKPLGIKVIDLRKHV